MSDSTVLGLIGTGKIGTAVMRGYCSEGGWNPKHVYVSSRSKDKADMLKKNHPDLITILESNQEIIDNSDVIFIGLLPHVAKEILPKLSFPKDKFIISMMATIPYEELLTLVGDVPKERVVRTVPLPSAAVRQGPILQYPINKEAHDILSKVGNPVATSTEEEVTKISCLTAFISFFYATCGEFHSWMTNNGVGLDTGRNFTSSFFQSLANAGFVSTEPFGEMAIEAATPGGLNEQTLKGLTEAGAFDLVADQVDNIYTRLTQKKPAERAAKRRKTE